MNIQLLLKIQNDNDDLTDEELLKLSSKKYIKRLISLGKENILIKVLAKNYILENGNHYKCTPASENSNNISLEELLGSAIKYQTIKLITYLFSKKHEFDKQALFNILNNSYSDVITNNIENLKLLLPAIRLLDSFHQDQILYSYLSRAIRTNHHEIIDVLVEAGANHTELSTYYIKRFSESCEIESFNKVLSNVFQKSTIKYLFTNILENYIKQGHIYLSHFISGEHNNYHKAFYLYCIQQAPHSKYYTVLKSLIDKGADFNEYLFFYAAKNNLENCVNTILSNKLVTARLSIEIAANTAFSSGNISLFNHISKAQDHGILPDEEAIISATQAGNVNIIEELIHMHENKLISDEFAYNIFDILNKNILNRAFLAKIAIDGNIILLIKLLDNYKLKADDYIEQILHKAIEHNQEFFVLALIDKFPTSKEHFYAIAAIHNKIGLMRRLVDKFGKSDIQQHFDNIFFSVINSTHDIDDEMIDLLFPVEAIKHDIFGYMRTFIWKNLLKSNNLILLNKLIKRQYPLYIDIPLYFEQNPSIEAVKLLISHASYQGLDKSDLIKNAINYGNYGMYKMLLEEIPLHDLSPEVRKNIERITQHAKLWDMSEQEYFELNAADTDTNKQRWEKRFSKEQLAELTPLLTYSLSPYGFNIKLYYEILPFLKNAMSMEGATDNHAIIAAYKLCVLFENKLQIMAYLENHIKHRPNAETPISDACHFSLPTNGIWDIKSWQHLVKTHGKQIAKFLHFAPLIEKELNKEDAPLNVILTSIEKQLLDTEKEYTAIITKNDINNKMQQYDKWLTIHVEQIAKSEKYKTTPMSENEKTEVLKKLRDQKFTELTQSIASNIQKEIQKKARIQLNKLLQRNQNISHLPENFRREAARSEIESRDLLNLTHKKVKDLVAEIAYANSDHDMPNFAHLCATHGITRHDFFDICRLLKKSKKIKDVLPELFVDGADLGESDYYFIKLAKDDPRGYILGELTNCCQSYGGNAEACVFNGTSSPYAGFYVLMKKGPNGKIDKYNDKIVAQSYAWITENGNLVFDSEESLQTELSKRWLNSFYTHAAKQAVRYHFDLSKIPVEQQNEEQYQKLISLGASPKIKAVFLGKGGGTPENLDLIPALLAEKPLSGTWLYGDATEQYILSEDPIPRPVVKL